jgi:hypothetical protein
MKHYERIFHEFMGLARHEFINSCPSAAASRSLGVGSAYAGEIEGITPDTFFKQLPGVIAQAPIQAPVVATAQNGQAVRAYVTQSNRGTWLLQDQGHEGANS